MASWREWNWKEAVWRLLERILPSHSSDFQESTAESSPVDIQSSEFSATSSATTTTSTNRPISATGTSQSFPAGLHASTGTSTATSVGERGTSYTPSVATRATDPFPRRKLVATSCTNTDESFPTSASDRDENISTAVTDASEATAEPARDTSVQTDEDSAGRGTPISTIETESFTGNADDTNNNAERDSSSFSTDFPTEPYISTTETRDQTKEETFISEDAEKDDSTIIADFSTAAGKEHLTRIDTVNPAEQETDTKAEAVISTEDMYDDKKEADHEVGKAENTGALQLDASAETDMQIQRETKSEVSKEEEEAGKSSEMDSSAADANACIEEDSSLEGDTNTELQDSARERDSGSTITIPSSSSGISVFNTGGLPFNSTISMDTSTFSTTSTTQQSAVDDTTTATSSPSGDVTGLPTRSVDLADADIDIEEVMNAALVARREQSNDDVSAPGLETNAETDDTTSTPEPTSPTSGMSMVMNNSDNASGNLQVGHLDNLTQNSLTVAGGSGGSGTGADGTDGDETGGGEKDISFAGKRYADKAFLAHLKRSLKKHPDMTPDVLETLCELYSDYAESEIRARDVTELFAILEKRKDMRTDDIIYLQTLLWSAGEKKLFAHVAEIADTWEKDFEETVSHLSTSVWDQGDDQLKFLIHKKRQDVTPEVLEKWKIDVAKLMKVSPKHFKIQGVEEDFSGKTIVTTESPAVVCEVLYKAMDKETMQEKLEELDVGKVAFEGIMSCQEEKVKVVKISQPENQKTWVTAPQCQQDLSEKLRLSLILGDILQADADVIVTGEDPLLRGFGDVSKTLLAAGGQAFKTERDEVLQKNGGTLSKGHVFITRGVRNFSLVVHAVLERWSQTSESVWTDSTAGLYTAAVEKSVERGYSRIGIPILGTGAGRAPPDKAMRAALQGLNGVSVPDKRKVQVLLYTKGKDILNVAEAELKKARS